MGIAFHDDAEDDGHMHECLFCHLQWETNTTLGHEIPKPHDLQDVRMDAHFKWRWFCTCGSMGAVRFDRALAAHTDHALHVTTEKELLND